MVEKIRYSGGTIPQGLELENGYREALREDPTLRYLSAMNKEGAIKDKDLTLVMVVILFRDKRNAYKLISKQASMQLNPPTIAVPTDQIVHKPVPIGTLLLLVFVSIALGLFLGRIFWG